MPSACPTANARHFDAQNVCLEGALALQLDSGWLGRALRPRRPRHRATGHRRCRWCYAGRARPIPGRPRRCRIRRPTRWRGWSISTAAMPRCRGARPRQNAAPGRVHACRCQCRRRRWPAACNATGPSCRWHGAAAEFSPNRPAPAWRSRTPGASAALGSLCTNQAAASARPAQARSRCQTGCLTRRARGQPAGSGATAWWSWPGEFGRKVAINGTWGRPRHGRRGLRARRRDPRRPRAADWPGSGEGIASGAATCITADLRLAQRCARRAVAGSGITPGR